MNPGTKEVTQAKSEHLGLRYLRANGWAVVVFSPKEMAGLSLADRDQIEAAMSKAAEQSIQALQRMPV